MSCKMLIKLLALSILLGGCSNTHSIVRQNKEVIPQLPFTDTFCIAVNDNSIYSSEKNDLIKSSMSQIIRSSLDEEGIIPTMEYLSHTFYDALVAARTSDCDYMFYTTIVRWENHSKEWSGIPNKGEIRISITDTNTGKNIDSAIISGNSRRIFSGDDPEDLLSAPVYNYISGFFRANSIKNK
jgi:hypothetical protein